MQKEKITDKEAICVLVLFLLGSALILSGGGDAKNDEWIATIIGIIMAVPMLLIFSRVLSLFQGKDLFDILEATLGKVAGKFVSILYVWYAFHLGALALRNFGEFVNTIAMPETPMFVFLFCLGGACIIAVIYGIEVVARVCAFFLPILIFILVVVQFLGIPQTHLDYIKPVLGDGIAPVMKEAFSVFSFPFAEIVIFMGISSSLKTKNSSFKVYFWGLLISGFLIVAITIRNILVLGNMTSSYYFPSYEAVSMISFGNFIQRIELSVSFAFIFGVFAKSSVCLLVACKGIGKIFNLENYRSIAIQTGLLMVYFSYTVYDNIIDMSYWAFKIYPYFAFPFQVILPIIIWILAEVKARTMNEQKV